MKLTEYRGRKHGLFRTNSVFCRGSSMSDMFTCCMISTNDGSNVLKVYTDADSNGKAEIITYIVIKRPYRPGTMRKLFPSLSRRKAQGSTGAN